jgi:heme A synthase
MRKWSWFSVGLIYSLLVLRNARSLPDPTSGAVCLNWPICTPAASPFTLVGFFLISLVLFAAVLIAACQLTWNDPLSPHLDPLRTRVLKLARSGAAIVAVQLTLGSLVKHFHAGLSCPQFPLCGEQLLPDPLVWETALAWIHRWWGILLVPHFLVLALRCARLAPHWALMTRRLFGLCLAQCFLGIGAVLSGLEDHSRISHAAVGYAFFGLTLTFALRSGALQWRFPFLPQAPRTPEEIAS